MWKLKEFDRNWISFDSNKKYKGYGKPRDSSETDLRVFHCLMWQRCAEFLEVETMM